MRKTWSVVLLVLLSSVVLSQNFTGGFNFYFPPDDTGSTRFIPRFPRSPLTDQDFVSIDGVGHFSVKGAPVRFFGANLVADGAFPTISKAASVAGRLRKMGFNLVRFHHMDNPWSSGSLFIQGSTTRQFNPSTLDRFEKIVAELKSNGIYADINLHVSRTFTAQDGLPDADSLKDFCKAINYFDPAVLALDKEFARQFLTHVNPYTGKSLADDPVMAMVEITNENSLYRYWRDGTLKPIVQGGILTVRHTKMLDTLWLSFLKSRYASTPLLAAAWNSGSYQSNQGNLLANGSFEDLQFITPWIMETHSPANASMLRDSVTANSGKYSAAVVVTQADGFDWHLQWKQIGLRMIRDSVYLVSFAARSDSLRSISVSLLKDVNPWTWYGGATILLTPQWKSYLFSVRAPETTDSARLSFTVGGQVGTYWFDDLALTVAGTDGLLADESFETSSVRRIDYARCSQVTDQRVRDMSSFYLKLEDDYFAHMRRYLKDTLNVKVPVVGTNWNIGPADMVVQSKLDFIDNHAYWDHPSFPGTPWSTTDWRIANTPMVQSQDGGTIARVMSAFPMSGKPFTISEYNHSFPNRFQSEALLFITGYGAFHNADAVMFFEYNSSSDDWESDNVANYFSIQRNSAMMALSPSCALAYRMGFISVARQTLTVNYAPDDYLTLPRRDASGWEGPNLVDRMLTLGHAVRTGSFASSTPFDPLSLPPSPVHPYVTDTKEITWDTRGLLSVASGRFVGATGFLNDFTNQRIGPVSIKAANGFGTFTLVSLTSDSLQEAQLSLLTISTMLQNSGMVWDGITSVHDNWGNAPTQVAPLLLTLQITLRADSVRVYPLDPSGRETRGFVTYLPSSPNLFTVAIDQSQQQSMWFGIQGFKGNLKPFFVAKLPDTTIAQNQILSFTYAATDFYRDSLKYTLVNPPAGASVTPAGVFTWKPTYSQAGAFPVMVVVSKTSAAAFADTARSTVFVTKVNQKPVLNSQTPAAGTLTTLSRNEPQMFAVSVTDPNGDPLTYTWRVNGGVVKTGKDSSYAQGFVDPHNTAEMVRVVWSKPNGVMPDSVTWNFLITLISTDQNVIPTEFAIAQNYPNPFNPSTNIQFDLSKAVPVTLEIYNILGVRIRTLVRGESMNAGRYTATWDSRDEGGTSVSSGMYVYRISAGDFHASKKMALVR